MLIKSIAMNNGQTVEVGRVTAFIGANNTGKSELLRDIFRLFAGGDPGEESQPAAQKQPTTQILRDVGFIDDLNQEKLLRGLTADEDEALEQMEVVGIGPLLDRAYRLRLASDAWHVLRRPKLEARAIWKTPLKDVLKLRVAYLPPSVRTQAVNTTPAISPAESPGNLLQALDQANLAVRAELDRAVAMLLPGQHIRLDDSQRIRLTLRMAAQFPDFSEHPAEAVQQWAQLPALDHQGEGCRSLVTLILSLLLAEGRAVLVDQPEAFLHPISARKLGVWIGQQAQRLYCQVFIATHSAELLAGLLTASSDVTIVRLTRHEKQTRLHPVPSDVGRELAQSPLSSIQPVLDCLFYHGVVVTKADVDRAIYQTVAQRQFGAGELMFIQAYGKRNLAYVMKLLRSAKVPAALIADLDVLDSKSRFAELIEVVTGEPPLRAWMATRDKLANLIEGALDPATLRSNTERMEQLLDRLTWGQHEPTEEERPARVDEDAVPQWSRIRQRGVDAIPEDLRPWVQDIVTELKQGGLFIVPRGELEAWMDVGVSRERKQEWFIKAVYALRSGEQPKELIEFVGDVVSYLRNQD